MDQQLQVTSVALSHVPGLTRPVSLTWLCFCNCREKKQKIQDIKNNIKEAIEVCKLKTDVWLIMQVIGCDLHHKAVMLLNQFEHFHQKH